MIMAVALTHWPRLALILRAEAQRVAHSDYLTLTWRLGHGHFTAGDITIYPPYYLNG